MKRLITFSIEHPLIVNLVTVFVFVTGIIAFVQMNREAFPNVSRDRVLVRTVYPGSDPKSVEKLITIPLERELKEISDIKEIRSISLEGQSILVIDLESTIANKDRVINEIQRSIDRVDDLPVDLDEMPVVTELRSKDQPIIEVSLSGDVSEEKLVEHAGILERRLLDIPQVAGVSRKGWRGREIWVEVEPKTLAEYSFSLSDFIGALDKHNVNIPGGVIKDATREYLIRSSGEFDSAKDVSHVVLRANDANRWVQIRDVAQVIDTFEEESVLHRTNGSRAINLVVIKKEKSDAIDLTDAVKKLVVSYRETVTDGLQLNWVNDFSFYIQRRLNVLYSNGSFGFLLVVLCLVFFLNPRVAFMTALGVPFALAATFFTMQLSGLTLNLLTMFGLITVLGMLVDDAIVIAENVYRHKESGLPIREACLKGTLEVWKPVTTSVLTTICVFLPLMFMGGFIGKFVKFIPLMVMIALLASLFEAFFILPSHLTDWSKDGRIKNHRVKDGFQKFAFKYISWLSLFLRNRYRVLIGFFLFFLFGIWLYYQLPFTLFPRRGVEIFFIRSEAPVGTPLEETARRFEPLERLVAALPKEEVDDFVLDVGIQQNDPHDPFTERFSHLGQINVFLTPPSSRKRSADEIVKGLKEKGVNVPGLAPPEFELLRPGPPVGKPVAIRVRGESLPDLKEVALKIVSDLEKIKGVKDIKLDETKGKEELSLKINPFRAALGGVGLKDIGLAIRASFEGLVATTIKKTDEEINVRVRFPKKSQESRENLKQVMIPNGKGDLIPLSQIALFEESQGVNAIRHFNRERTITVLANIDEKKISIMDVHEKMKSSLDRLHAENPEISIQFSGEFEDTQESFAGLKQAFFFGVLMIFMLLAIQFNSLWQPFVVMTTIPLGLIGVLLAFWLHGEPKSFLGLMGMVGLAGVVVNNAIVLVDFINEGRKNGMGMEESILKAGQLRLRPVLLTSATTVLGLVSLAYGFWGSDPFLKPMALAFVWGIFFSTLLTLIAIPCFHAIVDDIFAAFPLRFEAKNPDGGNFFHH